MLAAITSSPMPASAASRIWARLSLRGVLSAAQQRGELVAFGLAQIDPIAYVHRCPVWLRAEQMNHMSEPCHHPQALSFTEKQGQYLAFIHAYTLVMDRPPAEADLQRHFGVTPPSIHGMVLSLQRAGLIRPEPRRARSIVLLVDPNQLPPLRPRQNQPVKNSVTRY
jgi:hypothetical protein